MKLEVVLIALLVITNVMWAWNTHRLINKLMSRSFFEYKEALLQPKKETVEFNGAVPQDFEDFGSLKEIMPQ